MGASLAHLEILGPRAGLDGWLATLQRAGSCHLADALVGLEGESGIGRPQARDEERRAADLRAPALLALRGLAPLLPAVPAGGCGPAWSLPPGGVDEARLVAEVQRARSLAAGLSASAQALRASGAEVERLERWRAGLRALLEARRAVVPSEAALLEGRSERALARALAAAGLAPVRGRSAAFTVLALPEPVAPGAEQRLAALAGGTVVFEAASLGRPPAEALVPLEARLREAIETEARRREDLLQRLGREGAEARRTLDALEDAEARLSAHRLLAASGHVVAARAYAAPEHVADLRERLVRAHGGTVLIRPLAPGSDAPGPVESAPAAPLSALRALTPALLGERALASVLAVPAALWSAYVAGDAAVGLLLLLGGALLARGAGPGTPRRETGLLAQAAGLSALLAGLLAGRAAGGLGAGLLGLGWGLAPGWVPAEGAGAVGALLAGAAVAGLVLAVAALLVALRRRARRRIRAAQAAEALLRPASTLGLACLALASGSTWAATAAALSCVATFVLASSAERVRLLLDLAGVAALALGALGYVLALPAVWAGALGPAAPLLGALVPAALVLEAARAAMGLTHPVVLGRAAQAPAFTPFAAQGRSGRGDGL